MKTVFMMSEFYSLGKLTPVLSGLAQGRKYSVRFAPMVIQDIAQLSEVYGQHGANSVIGNSGAVLAFSPSPGDIETSGFLSKSAGDHSVIVRSASVDPQDGSIRINISEQREPLWPPEKIRTIPKFHALAWKSGTVQPVYCPPYWTTKLARRAAADPYHASGSSGGGRRRGAGKVIAVALLAGLIIGALSTIGGLDVRGDDPPKANPPARHPAPPMLHQKPERR
jgi:hypothetical protein